MIERKEYYDAFQSKKDAPESKEFSNIMYSKYKEAGEKITSLKNKENVWKNLLN